MSIATLAPNLALPSNNDIPSLVVGESRSYYFYEKLSISNTSSSTKYQHRNKPIIPSIPRERIKAPVNSPLSPIRSSKVPSSSSSSSSAAPPCTGLSPPQRPYPLLSATSLPTVLQIPTNKKRGRKVSFNEQVVVVCTVFDSEEDEGEEHDPESETGQRQWFRRWSTGSTPQQEDDETGARQSFSKVTTSLKRLSQRLLPSSELFTTNQ